jgi:serine phosphatase RsbU (regulator of sigma subunit)
MKILMKIIMVLFLVGIVSCRHTKKEEAEAEAVIEKIEAVENEAEEISKKINEEAKEVESALKELDSI